MLKLVEVYKRNLEPYAHGDITASVRYGRKYGFRDILVNPQHIVAVYPHNLDDAIAEGLLPEDLDPRHEFTRMVMNSSSAGGLSLIVVSSLSRINKQLQQDAAE